MDHFGDEPPPPYQSHLGNGNPPYYPPPKYTDQPRVASEQSFTNPSISRSAIARGDMESARSHSSTARQLSNISVIAGVAFLLVGMLIAGLYWFFGVIPNMSSGPQEYQDWSVLEICRETKQCKNDLLFNKLFLTFKLVYVSAARNFALLAAIVH